MAFDSKLQKTFYEDLKRLSLFDEAVKLVKETYKLEVEVDKSKTEFVIKADGSELLEFVQTLLESWLEGKKKEQSDKFEDRIKVTKENPLSDIFDGHIVWVFWGDLATKLSSDIYRKEVEKLKLVQESSVSLKYEKSGRLIITCNFKTFKDIKSKVESLKLLAVSGKHDIGKVKTDASKSHVSKDNGSGNNENGDLKVKDHNGTSEFRMTAGIANQDKLVKSETSTDNGEDLKQNLLPDLRGSNHASDQSPHGTGSEEKGVDDKLLFCSPSGKIKVFVYEASITKLSGIDAIVNAANEDLKHIGGVAYNISKAAGGDKSSLEKECFDYIKQKKKVDVTKNFTSSAGNMPYKRVIHAVGPMWSDYKAKEDCAKDLCITIMNVLVEADSKMFSKIALPAISSGIFGVPRRLCAEMYIKGVIDYDSKSPQTQMKEVHFVDIKKDILLEIRDAYRRWQQDDSSLDFKNANSYSSSSGENGSSGQHSQTVRPEGSFRQIPSASHYQKDITEIHSFQLAKHTSVKVYKWSIVEVRGIDAIVCAINPDFTIQNRQVACLIRERAGYEYETEFKQMATELHSKTREDVLICGAGKLAETQQIKYVIHITLGKIKTIEDINKIKHLYIQAFETARRKNIFRIALPLIGAASLKYASDADIQSCSQLFVKTLKEVVKERGKGMSVQEVHLVDQDAKIISYVVKAFQEQGKHENDSHVPLSGDGQSWLTADSEIDPARSGQTSQAAKKCCQCGKQGIEKKFPNCSHGLCHMCIAQPIGSGCPFCKQTADENKMMKTTKAKASNKGSNTESKETKKCPSCKDVLTNPTRFPCGHEVHANCIKQSQQNQLGCPICGTLLKKTTEEEGSKEGRSTESEEPEKCPICMDVLTDPECLPCGHNFHADCIKQSLEYRLACPICGIVMGKLFGNQPEGKMSDSLQNYSLPGYEGCKTIEIFYNMPDGIQKDIHPHPGRRYTGTQRKAFLPDNSEGKKVLKLLKIAFDRKLIFTIGESRTTGKTDIVTWNDIHHKTKATGGPTNFGYPDKTYLSRVQEELAAKGVTEKDIEDIPSGCMIS